MRRNGVGAVVVGGVIAIVLYAAFWLGMLLGAALIIEAVFF